MLVTWSWLNQYIDLSRKRPKEVAEALTARGIEVASLEVEGKEALFDLEITPNRPDCLSVLGLCRELASVYGTKVALPKVRLKEEKTPATNLVSVRIDDSKLCPLYTARVIEGVTIGESPPWLKRQLEAIGVRSINNVVDVTNFVLFEWGQPLHAFDLDCVGNSRGKAEIRVRSARPGEEIMTLDGKRHTLTQGDVVIGDGQGEPLALGGVMGGIASEVTLKTKRVLLESALFSPIAVRKSAKRLGIKSDSSYRFERGVDPEGVLAAQDRAAALIAEISGGKVLRGRILAGSRRIAQPRLKVSLEYINRLLGTDLSSSAFTAALKKIGMKVEGPSQKKIFAVTPPTWRRDIERPADIAEEAARSIGYETIKSRLPRGILAKLDESKLLRKRRLMRTLRERLSGLGVDEIYQFSFSSLKEIEPFLQKGVEPIRLENPIGENLAYLKPSLLPGLLNVVSSNLRRGVKDFAIYEMRRVFHPLSSGKIAQPREKVELAIALTGLRYPSHWAEKGRGVDFYDLKGCVEALCLSAGIEILLEVPQSSASYFHPTAQGELRWNDLLVGRLGEIHPDVLSQFDIDQKVFAATLDIEQLSEQAQWFGRVQQVSNFPPVHRDIALVIDEAVSARDVEKAIWGAGAKWLAEVNLFDLYRGAPIPQGKKSLAYSLLFLSPAQTLSEEEVDRELKKIIDFSARKMGAALRS
ncbi:MAG: phenylalanine--tRNA ligase subunit beta [Deltaproteobacteria bacterium]|nr:phenylalanine--tRNA ligase subunit beta [Deltaproteobacteria bacterium]